MIVLDWLYGWKASVILWQENLGKIVLLIMLLMLRTNNKWPQFVYHATQTKAKAKWSEAKRCKECGTRMKCGAIDLFSNSFGCVWHIHSPITHAYEHDIHFYESELWLNRQTHKQRMRTYRICRYQVPRPWTPCIFAMLIFSIEMFDLNGKESRNRLNRDLVLHWWHGCTHPMHMLFLCQRMRARNIRMHASI